MLDHDAVMAEISDEREEKDAVGEEAAWIAVDVTIRHLLEFIRDEAKRYGENRLFTVASGFDKLAQDITTAFKEQ